MRPRRLRNTIIKCPRCSSVNIILVGKYFNTHLGIPKQRYRCIDCRKTFYIRERK